MDSPSKKQTLVLCSCDKTIKYATSQFENLAYDEIIHTDQLCQDDLDIAVAALTQCTDATFACEQQAQIFEQLCQELQTNQQLTAELGLVDLRDRAGWTASTEDVEIVTAKQVALLADAALDRPGAKVRDVHSAGTCLVIARDASALSLAETLGEELAVTCVLENISEAQLPSSQYDLARGIIESVSGGLGAFEVTFREFSRAKVTGRGPCQVETPRAIATSNCDIIIDLVSEDSLLAAESTRTGYLRAPSTDAMTMMRLGATAKGLVGTFEKPLYVNYEGSICAHSRSKKIGCTRCIDTCGAQAIRPNEDGIYIDPDICGGCGGCASVCPTGAITYDDPPFDFFVNRIKTLISKFTELSNKRPRIIFVDRSFGRSLIESSARLGRGLPADVIPYEVDNVELIGHSELLACFGAGASGTFILKSPKTAKTAIVSQTELTHRLLSGTAVDTDRVQVIEPEDHEALSEALYTSSFPELDAKQSILLGGRREVAKQVISTLINFDVEKPVTIDLKLGDPYGKIEVDSDKCTLCLACVSQCPTGALNDRSDRPEINLVENACVQCGLCANTCPEQAIKLIPQLSFGKHTLTQQPLHGEDPFECIECKKPFGVKSTIEKIVGKLEGIHWMYTNSDNIKLVKMCDDCRVNAQYHDENAPLKGADRPRVRTTDDYLDS